MTHGTVLDELHRDGVRVVEVAHGSALVLDTHAHDTTKLCIVLDGGVTERHDADIVAPRPFELLLRPAGRPHENQYHAHGARQVVVELERTDQRLRGLPPVDELAALAPDGAVAARLVGALRRPRTLEAALVDAIKVLAARRPAPKWLRAAREQLVERLADPPPLAELARAVGVHPVHLAQTFARRYGITVRRFIRMHRVFRAIEHVDVRPLGVLAAEVGFADQSHMTRAFRAERDAPPGAVRARVRHP